MKYYILYIACICSLSFSAGFAQHLTSVPHHGVEDVPITEDVYPFLRHLSVRGIITGYSESALPISEYEIVTFLKEALTKDLSEAERSLATKYVRTYAREPYEAITMFPADSAEPLFFGGMLSSEKDKYLYRWKDDSTNSDLQVNAVASLEYRHRSKPETGSAALGVIGGRFQGTLSGHVGYYMETTNGQSFGDSTIALQDPVIGKNKNFALYSNHTFYDFTSAELAYNYDWFTGKITRIPVSFGGGYQQDNITINPNVPLYDVITIAGAVGAVRYQAEVASLLGDAKYSVPPDSSYYEYGPGAYIDPKYLALHHLNITLSSEFEFGFTDMVIFSRRFDIAYLNPFAFLKSMEHAENDRDNGLIAAHLRWKITNGFEIRGQGLVDDIVASKIGTGYWGNKFAWQGGFFWAAPFGAKDLDFSAEYTQVQPYTYSHFNPQNAFVTSGTILGSQIGPNSVSIWTALRWAPSSKLHFSLSAMMIARGENIYDSTGALLVNYGADVEQSVRNEEEKQRSYHVLDGNRVNVFIIDAEATYELVRGFDIFLRAMDKNVNYLSGTPVNPLQTPYGLLTIGAKALF